MMYQQHEANFVYFYFLFWFVFGEGGCSAAGGG
jgi:hypothetical protein